MNKTVIPRELARSDVEEAIDYYVREAGNEIALGFIDSLQEAYALIANHPEAGSLRYAYELGLPDLRSVSLKRYPYLIFYRDQPDHVDVWRVLHAKRDIPQWMQEPNNH
ncbi:type II toxin-antitoxin system RelE/ParE family toxin (plasmid) [Sinorhizobium meliloti]|uniref:type II toxin-antitoxin system RelE/ParE family toxin n=1 Tax=Rhizobium meliloti TaxID=382 RepID=UPI000B5A7420|nr:type II toxin-antitoxin system RelE/ParE family toxin [Sinorhizobium meliloti]ASJ62086.1 plasmid stabilization protein [Sinorhizobium meliloti]MCK3784846.1 type II toxin-antitoxin system RelE/ParE family toxin [Sinorhizobium meliloti]MCK3790971.1 type II toxin-antitoxin system RelE/ParE family toxin [Sinorhizobium meliloti]MCK3797900.1 type II toxin-antitoxin system RelE/ParE family toxin [Sinorhizobium meliloti]MDX0231608.1 type II toxin-antitoxin system RelE/ParE family toxin [Sinorhizobi